MALVYKSPHYPPYEYESLEVNPDYFSFRLRHALGGSMMTSLAISQQDFRKAHPTKAALRRHCSVGAVHTFIVSDDWGSCFQIQVDGQAQPEELGKLLRLMETLKA